MLNESQKQELRDKAMSGSVTALAIDCEIGMVEGSLDSAKKTLKSRAESIQRRVEESIEFVAGDRAYMSSIQGLGADYDVAIAEVTQLVSRLEGLSRIADRMMKNS